MPFLEGSQPNSVGGNVIAGTRDSAAALPETAVNSWSWLSLRRQSSSLSLHRRPHMHEHCWLARAELHRRGILTQDPHTGVLMLDSSRRNPHTGKPSLQVRRNSPKRRNTPYRVAYTHGLYKGYSAKASIAVACLYSATFTPRPMLPSKRAGLGRGFRQPYWAVALTVSL